MLQIRISILFLGALCQGLRYYCLSVALQMADALNMQFQILIQDHMR